jgi:predicted enzyme related to lactoylglutathione lyase
MIQGIRLGNVMVDCGDGQKLCEFYHQLLGWEKCEMFGLPAVNNQNGIVFLFIQEEGYLPPAWPEEPGQQQKQMHFDFQVPDVEKAAAYAEALGAVRPSSQYGGKEWITLLDPAGHPFCLCDASNQ